jgi:hypothetical protein
LWHFQVLAAVAYSKLRNARRAKYFWRVEVTAEERNAGEPTNQSKHGSQENHSNNRNTGNNGKPK